MQHARKRLIFLILGSLALLATGCASGQELTLRTRVENCPRPALLCADDLPAIDGNVLFDSPENISVLMQRHNIMRQHIQAQDAALDCYAEQARGQ